MYCTSYTGGGLPSCRAHGRCRSASCTCTVGPASPRATVLRAALPYEVQYTDSVRRKKACARSKPRRGPLSPRPPLSARPEVNSAARSRTTGIFQPALAAHNPCGCGPDQPSLGVAALVAFRRAWQGRRAGAPGSLGLARVLARQRSGERIRDTKALDAMVNGGREYYLFGTSQYIALGGRDGGDGEGETALPVASPGARCWP
jgi:hypothetical protein